jgi:hypothetical protein
MNRSYRCDRDRPNCAVGEDAWCGHSGREEAHSGACDGRSTYQAGAAYNIIDTATTVGAIALNHD